MSEKKVWDSSMLDIEESKTVAERVNAKNRQCFLNSVYALSILGESDDVVYVEGYVVADDFRLVMEHGWVENGDRIIDCTPTYHSDRTTRRYFPVDRYTRAQVLKKIKGKKSTTLPFQQMPWRDVRWREVNEEAQRYAYGDTQYEKLKEFHASFNKKSVTK